MAQILQWGGAVLCLIAFGLSQRGAWPVVSLRYLASNLVGGTLLSVSALLTSQWGFVLLEGVWAAVAAWGIRRRWVSAARAARAPAPARRR